jgi:pimeloyl-ACP methyl ester carboxylesterase
LGAGRGKDGFMSERFALPVEGGTLAGERWPGGVPVVVLLHGGLFDRRSWREVAERLAPLVTVVAYDRRGHGESAASTAPFTHVDDLLAILDDAKAPHGWIVGTSAGGGVALDAAIAAPDRVTGLVLIGTAVSGAPAPEMDATLQRFDELWDAAEAAGDLEAENRLNTWLRLDGPYSPEGRVGGAARALTMEMYADNRRDAGPGYNGASDVAAWSRLAEVTVPVTVACGDLDVAYLVSRSRELATRLPKATYHELAGTAHLPYLDQPGVVADLILDALRAG